MTEVCDSVLEYTAQDRSNVVLPCMGLDDHDGKCWYQAEDGSRAEWEKRP